MSVTIRLSRIGKTGAPAFKIVAATTRDKANGRPLEILGHFNPSHNPPLLQLDKERFNAWKKNGAIVSPAVAELAEDKYEFKPYTRQNEMKTDDDAQVVADNAAVVAEVEAGKEVAAEQAAVIEEAEVAKAEAVEESQQAQAAQAEEAQAAQEYQSPAQGETPQE